MNQTPYFCHKDIGSLIRPNTCFDFHAFNLSLFWRSQCVKLRLNDLDYILWKGNEAMHVEENEKNIKLRDKDWIYIFFTTSMVVH